MQPDHESWKPEGRYKIEPIRGEGGRLDIHDYRCQICRKLIYASILDSRHCPHCGGEVFAAPHQKLSGQQRRGRTWEDLKGMQYTGPARTKTNKWKSPKTAKAKP